jgi:hypothetical protein
MKTVSGTRGSHPKPRAHQFLDTEVCSSGCPREEANMRHLSVWILEFFKLIGRRRLHPLVAQCPVCQQMVRLHVDQAGRRHVFAHARDLYEGSRISVHYAAKFKCIGSGSRKLFDPRPNERQRFKLPNSLLEQ